MRRLLPVLGLLIVLLLAGIAAWVVLGGGDEGAGGGSPDRPPPGVGGTAGSDDDAGQQGRERASAPGRVQGLVRLLAEDRPAVGVVVTLTMGDGDRIAASTDSEGRFGLSAVPSGEPFDLVVEHGELAPVLRPGLLVEPRTTLDVGTLYLASGVPVVVEVRTTDGQPLPGATASAYVTGEGTANFDVAHAVRAVATALSDAKGEARFPALPPGAWTLTAQKPSYARRGLPSVTVRAASEEERFRIVLERGYTLTGSVLDRDGNPVANAPMLAIRRTLSSNASTAPLAVRTASGADGRYRLDNLPGQDMVVWAGWPGGRLAVLAAVRLPNVRDLDVVLDRGGRLEGRITAEDGATPVAGATVTASLAVLDSFDLSFEDITDEDGEYAFEFPMPGAVSNLSATARGHGYGEPSLGGDGEILIPEGFVARRDFSLGAGLVVTGTVRGPDGPVAGADIGATNESWWSETKTDAAGRYELTGMSMMRFVILASRAGLVLPERPLNPDADLESGTVAERYVADLTGGTPAVVDFELVAGPEVPGRVVDEAGDPIEGATLAAWGQAEIGATTDTDGRFVIRGSGPANPYSVLVSHPEFRTGSVDLPAVAEGEEPEPMLVQLTRAPVVRGLVTDAGGRVPEGTYVQIVPWSSELRDPASEEWSWLSVPRHPVGRDGRFEQRMVAEDAVGRIVVRAGAPGFAVAASSPLRVSSDEAVEVALLLSPGVAITGRVKDADGAPVPRANVAATAAAPGTAPDDMWYPGAWGSPIVAVCDDAGRFSMPALREGRYVLRSWSREHLEERVAVDAPDDDIVIRLGASLVIAGTASLSDGSAVAGARIECTRDDGEDWQQTRVAEDGTFRITGLSPGTYTVTLSPAPDNRQNLRTTSVDGVVAGTRDLVIRAEPGLVLRGVVATADGSPLGESGLDLYRTREHIVNQELDDGGAFEIAGLDDGGYLLEVWSERSSVGNAVFHNVRATGDEQRFVLPVPARVRGVLLGLDSEGLPGVTISFQVTETEDGAHIQPSELSAETDDDGRFTLDVARGVAYEAYLGSHETLTLQGDVAVRAGRGEIRLEAGRGLTITGRVLDESGAPLENATVWASGGNHNRSVTTGEDGAFVLTGLHAEQTYNVGASKDEFLTDTAEGVPGKDVEFRLQRGLPLAGRVIDRAGEPYGDVQIQAIRLPEGAGSWGTWVDTDGHFDFGVMPRGRFEIRVNDMRGEEVPCGVAESGATDVIVHLPR